MIHKNIDFGNIKNTTVADFRFGTVSMVVSENDEMKNILLKSQKAKSTGNTKEAECKDSDEYAPELVLAFKDGRSIDQLIDTLQECRELFVANTNKLQIGR